MCIKLQRWDLLFQFMTRGFLFGWPKRESWIGKIIIVGLYLMVVVSRIPIGRSWGLESRGTWIKGKALYWNTEVKFSFLICGQCFSSWLDWRLWSTEVESVIDLLLRRHALGLRIARINRKDQDTLMEHSLQCRIPKNNTDMMAELNSWLQESGRKNLFEYGILSVTSFTLRTTRIAGTRALAGI